MNNIAADTGRILARDSVDVKHLSEGGGGGGSYSLSNVSSQRIKVNFN